MTIRRIITRKSDSPRTIFVGGITGSLHNFAPFFWGFPKEIDFFGHADTRLFGNQEKKQSLATTANIFFNELEKESPECKEYNIILYSYSCLLAPYVQQLMNQNEKLVKFTLIDQPTVDILRSQNKIQKITHAHDVLLRVAVSLGLNIRRLDKDELARVNERNDSLESILEEIFHLTIPNYDDQIRSIGDEISSANERFCIRELTKKLDQCQTIPKLTLTNLISLYVDNLELEKTALLDNVQIISTSDTLRKFNQNDDPYLGWLSNCSNPNKVTVVKLDADHFSIMNSDTSFYQTLKKSIIDYHDLLQKKLILFSSDKLIEIIQKLPEAEQKDLMKYFSEKLVAKNEDGKKKISYYGLFRKKFLKTSDLSKSDCSRSSRKSRITPTRE